MSALVLSAAPYSPFPSPPHPSPARDFRICLRQLACLSLCLVVFAAYFSPTTRSYFISLFCPSFSSFPQTWGPTMS